MDLVGPYDLRRYAGAAYRGTEPNAALLSRIALYMAHADEIQRKPVVWLGSRVPNDRLAAGARRLAAEAALELAGRRVHPRRPHFDKALACELVGWPPHADLELASRMVAAAAAFDNEAIGIIVNGVRIATDHLDSWRPRFKTYCGIMRLAPAHRVLERLDALRGPQPAPAPCDIARYSEAAKVHPCPDGLAASAARHLSHLLELERSPNLFDDASGLTHRELARGARILLRRDIMRLSLTQSDTYYRNKLPLMCCIGKFGSAFHCMYSFLAISKGNDADRRQWARLPESDRI
ncbi:MAG: hypothetical protein K2X57_29130 [Xanthobacteraceae bacterium]|nr:hypothetical protein [Xanthobacteraceae bacterium]